MSISYRRDTFASWSVASLFTTVSKGDQPGCPTTDKDIMKMSASYKKNEIMKFKGKCRELQSIILNEETDLERQEAHALSYI